MTNFRQTLHVMAKDLGESRLVLAAYLAITALATVAAVRPGWINRGGGSDVAALLLPVFGMVLVASFVQGDSPTRADAFWASRPLNPYAVLAAKVVLALVIVVALPLLGQLAALLVRRAGYRVLTNTIGESALTYAKWLTVAFVAAAISKDLKTFLLALGTIPIVVLTLISVAMDGSGDVAVALAVKSTSVDVASWAAVFAGAGGCMALIVYLYRTRDARWRTWLAALTFCYLLVQSPSEAAPLSGAIEAPPNVARTTFTINMNPASSSYMNGMPQRTLALTPDSVPPLQRLAFIDGKARVRGLSGVTVQVLNRTRLGRVFAAHALTDVTWLGEHQEIESMGLALVQTDSLRRIEKGGIADVQVDGRILVHVPGPSDTLDLRPGSSIARNGSMVTISRWNFANGQATLVFMESSVPANFDPFTSDGEQAEFSLVNERRHEAVALVHRSGGNGGGWLVLPGVQMSSGEQVYQNQTALSRPGIDSTVISDEWFREARLVVSHWISVGSYPIHSENSNPLQLPKPLSRQPHP